MQDQKNGPVVPHWITAIFAIAAAVMVAYGISIALDEHDTEPLESPLMLSVARQLIHGPSELYGPFGARNPLVIIHAPLYYHLAALLAWPLFRAGLDPVTAAWIAGRTLSFLGFCGTIAAAYRMTRLGGAARAAGIWAALLIAGSIVVGTMPYTVRPDMLGVAFQTTGVLLVLTALSHPRPHRAALPLAFAAFAVAAAIKQLFIIAPIVSTFLLFAQCLRRRLPLSMLVGGLVTGLAIGLTLYGSEELFTGGRMSQAVFEAALSTSRIHPADWIRALIVFVGIMGKCSGPIALLVAVNVAEISATPGTVHRALALVGLTALLVISVRVTSDCIGLEVTSWDMVITAGTLAFSLFVFLPIGLWFSPGMRNLGPIDRALIIYLAGEVGLLIFLSRASTGAWINYGIQLIVFASVLAARAIMRALSEPLTRRRAAPVALAALTLLIGVYGDVRLSATRRRIERQALDRLFQHFNRPPHEFFFFDRPGVNRTVGRVELVFDDWLYPVFEAIHLAQHRSDVASQCPDVGRNPVCREQVRQS